MNAISASLTNADIITAFKVNRKRQRAIDRAEIEADRNRIAEHLKTPWKERKRAILEREAIDVHVDAMREIRLMAVSPWRQASGAEIRDYAESWSEFFPPDFKFGQLTLQRIRDKAKKYATMADQIKQHEADNVIRLKPSNGGPGVAPKPGDVPPLPESVIAQMAGPSVEEQQPAPDMILSGADFVAGFVPPDYVLDGIFQRGFLYAITGKTGTGKTAGAMRISAHVDTGRPLGSRYVDQGAVLYFAGENPTDIQMRWIGLTDEMKIDRARSNVHFVSGVVNIGDVGNRIAAELARKGIELKLVVVDTVAAYFPGDDENNNVQMGAYARLLRSLVNLPGKPAVLALAHPTKGATDDNIVPKGGGSFLNEIDGNVALRRVDGVIAGEPHGKFRGPEFNPLYFELKAIRNPKLRDTRGRDIPTVIACPVDDGGIASRAKAALSDEDAVLNAIAEHPRKGRGDLAKLTGMNEHKIDRAAKKLTDQKLIVKERTGWTLTSKGERELNVMESAAHTVSNDPAEMARRFFAQPREQ
jgi:predicted transcriptional regulator